MRARLSLASLLVASFVALSPAQAEARSCDALKRLALPDVTIERATDEATGPFTGDNGIAPPTTVPAFCRVAGTIRPTSRSNIRFEVWLPADWNGRFQGVGNGGLAGSIGYRVGLVEAVQGGYAAASTDTGHIGDAGTSAWARGEPEKIADYGYRAIHLTALVGKAIVAAYYGRAADRSYFASCSNGGREALMEAQRFPDDYDGIIAGAPAYNFTRLMAGFGWNAHALFNHDTPVIPPMLTPLIAHAVLRQCDGKDGVLDGVVADPRQCRFDPRVLLCRPGQTGRCLSASQVDALARVYRGARLSSGKILYPGWSPGGEVGQFPGMGWEGWMFGTSATGNSQAGLLRAVMRDFVTGNAAWDVDRFDVDRDPALLRERYGKVLDATDPDLGRFWARGGKLILFHGWSDAAIAPQGTIDYYDAVRRRMGPHATAKNLRLFMVPGMQHCFGGAGPNSFGGLMAKRIDDPKRDLSAALERWVEQGVPPNEMIATRYDNLIQGAFDPAHAKPLSTGLLCSYPRAARWTGKGSTTDAANYICVASSGRK